MAAVLRAIDAVAWTRARITKERCTANGGRVSTAARVSIGATPSRGRNRRPAATEAERVRSRRYSLMLGASGTFLTWVTPSAMILVS